MKIPKYDLNFQDLWSIMGQVGFELTDVSALCLVNLKRQEEALTEADLEVALDGIWHRS